MKKNVIVVGNEFLKNFEWQLGIIFQKYNGYQIKEITQQTVGYIGTRIILKNIKFQNSKFQPYFHNLKLLINIKTVRYSAWTFLTVFIVNSNPALSRL